MAIESAKQVQASEPRQHITEFVAHGLNLLASHELWTLHGIGQANGLLDAAGSNPDPAVHPHRNLEGNVLAEGGEQQAVRAQQLPMSGGED